MKSVVLIVGEILFDVFPDYRRLGGAPFNFAFHMKKLGFSVRFFSRVGDDTEGREILSFLKFHGFNLEDIQVDPHHATGRVNIAVDAAGNHEFEIVEDASYDHIEFTDQYKKVLSEDHMLIYFGTLIQRTKKGFETLQTVFQHKSPAAKNFLDINLRPQCYTPDTVNGSLKAADLLKLNQDELETVTEIVGGKIPWERRVEGLMKEYDLEKVFLTKGKYGSEIFSGSSHTAAIPDNTVIMKDSVGAGDAWAAMAAAGYLAGEPQETVVWLAHSFASHICTIKGALPETDDDIYQKFKKEIRRR